MKTLNEYLNNKNGVVQEGTGCATCKITNADRVNKTIEESANLVAALLRQVLSLTILPTRSQFMRI